MRPRRELPVSRDVWLSQTWILEGKHEAIQHHMYTFIDSSHTTSLKIKVHECYIERIDDTQTKARDTRA